MLFIRQSKPKLPQPSQRFGYIVSFGFIVFLILLLINDCYPFPTSIVATGNILGGLILIPLLLYLVYLDYKAYKTTHDTSA